MGRATPTPSPSKVPSFRYLSRTMFRTGECSAAQSIFLCPSGARDGSLTMDSLCIAPPLTSAGGTGLFLGGLDLFATAEQEASEYNEREERKEGQPYDRTARTPGARGEPGGGDALVVEAEP